MEKSTKKRGRPEIKPYIKRLIASRVFDEEKKPLEARMPPKVLAYEIYKELIQQGEERTPKPSTIEKRISEYRNHPASLLDSPWSIGCLARYDIPPEALPKVMLICEKHFREFKRHITIRQVLWMARLYKIIDDPITLKNFAFMYESHEWFDWVSGNPIPTYTRDIDLTIIQHMAWRIATDKTGEYCADIAKHPFLFRSLQALAKESKEELEGKLRNKDYMLCSKLTEEEAQNERQHKTEKQK